jgi:hypothetical protein
MATRKNKMSPENKLIASIRRQLCLVSGAAVLSLASASSMATVVCGPTTNISVPENIDGVYLNLVTGATGTAAAGTPGWDINLYETGTIPALYFFWPTPAANSGGVAAGTIYSVLTSGTLISAASTFIQSAGGGGPPPYVNWQASNTGNYLGVRFLNEATTAINFGWLQLNTTATNGFPATIVSYCYQNDGTGIMAGTTPVSLQSYSVE